MLHEEMYPKEYLIANKYGYFYVCIECVSLKKKKMFFTNTVNSGFLSCLTIYKFLCYEV